MHNVFLLLLSSSICPVFVPHYFEYRSKSFTRFTLRVNNHSINCESDENWYEPYHYKSHTVPVWYVRILRTIDSPKNSHKLNISASINVFHLKINKFIDNNMLFYGLFFDSIRLKKNLKEKTNNNQRLQLEYSKYSM